MGLTQNATDLSAENLCIVFTPIILDQINSESINHCERRGCSWGEKLLNFAQKNNFISRMDYCNNASSLFTNTKVIPALYDSHDNISGRDGDRAHGHDERSFVIFVLAYSWVLREYFT